MKKLKFFGRSKDEKNKKTVLFVCVQNAGRSQIAEAFFRKYAPDNYEALSAGTEPAGNLNPLAIEAMKEVGVDISKQRPKIITEDMIRKSTARVNMGCIREGILSHSIHPRCNRLEHRRSQRQTTRESKRD